MSNTSTAPTTIGAAHAGMLAIVGGTVIDGNGGSPVERGVLLIKGNRIVAVEDHTAAIPPHARVVSAEGKYIIPGLMDANVHLMLDNWPLTLIRYENRYDELAIEAAQLTLKNGVTTVFDTWGPREYLIKARNAVADGRICASRIYLAGNIVGLNGPVSDDFYPQFRDVLLDDFSGRTNAIWQENVGQELMWMSPEQVRGEVRKYVARNIDFVKYAVTGHPVGAMQYIQFSPRVQQVIVEEAHRAGLTVQTHTTSLEGLHLAVQAGVDLMQHADLTGPQRMPDDIIALLVERQIPCALLANTTKALAWYRRHANTTPFFHHYEIADLNDRALIQAGAVLLLSTDGGIFGPNTSKSSFFINTMPPDEALSLLGEGHFHWLLAAEEKGMRPMDALLAATRNIARAYKVDRDLGTMEKGKIADLLILDKNPLASAANYRAISAVIKDGKIVDRDSLPTQRLLTEPHPADADARRRFSAIS